MIVACIARKHLWFTLSEYYINLWFLYKPSAQSDREKEEGLPVAPFMDRDKVTKSSAQIGFIKFVLIPMFQTLAKVFPIIDELMVTQLKSALERYEKLQAEEEERKKNGETLTDADWPPKK